MSGIVYLVGAGPGDPGLFTLRGRELLERADVVVYDALANPRVVAMANPNAEMRYVGKRGGDHTLKQEDIGALLVELGQAGKRVVRLKGGDPFVFGRGGEEAEDLEAAGIPFEVVPGITAAVAAPAYAGIPVTHRADTPTFALVTGHEDPTKDESGIDWQALATGIGTVAFYMGVRNLPNIARRLIEGGRDPQTPVAVIRWGTTPQQRTVTGPLCEIADRVKAAGITAPALTLVGNVVRHRKRLQWFENRPLFGKRIVVTRARAQASDLVDALAAKGAEVIEAPTIRIVPPADMGPVEAAARDVAQYDYIIFTSVNGVTRFFDAVMAAHGDIRGLGNAHIVSIGSATTAAVESYRIAVDLTPPKFVAESILETLLARESVAGKRILLPRAAQARSVLPDTLAAEGATVDVVDIYDTVPEVDIAETVRDDLLANGADAITFTSSSTVRFFFTAFGEDAARRILAQSAAVSIGPITSDTLREFDVPIALEADQHDIPGLIAALEAHDGLATPVADSLT